MAGICLLRIRFKSSYKKYFHRKLIAKDSNYVDNKMVALEVGPTNTKDRVMDVKTHFLMVSCVGRLMTGIRPRSPC